MELLLKVVASGFVINGDNSYLRNSWNILDFVIVVISILSLVYTGVNLGAFKVLRMLRVLRPLRMISKKPGLRCAIQSLINAIPDIGNVMVVCVLFLLLFAILGTNFYKGLFFHCHTDNIPAAYVSLIKDKFDCLDYGGEWVNEDQNFDHVGSAVVTLFNVMTTEGWINVMWTAVDSTAIDRVPDEKGHNRGHIFFFLSFMIIGSLFVLNMFVGIVINVFGKEKNALEMNHLLTQTEVDWCEVLIFCYSSKPEVKFLSTGNKLKDACHSIAMNSMFDTFIFFCIVLNTICLGLTWHGEPPFLKLVLDQFNLIFTGIYTIECIIKLIAFNLEYFQDGWNNFDFVIVIAAWAGLIVQKVSTVDLGGSTSVIRAFRISRIFKIIKKYRNLRILFYTFIGAIP